MYMLQPVNYFIISDFSNEKSLWHIPDGLFLFDRIIGTYLFGAYLT